MRKKRGSVCKGIEAHKVAIEGRSAATDTSYVYFSRLFSIPYVRDRVKFFSFTYKVSRQRARKTPPKKNYCVDIQTAPRGLNCKGHEYVSRLRDHENPHTDHYVGYVKCLNGGQCHTFGDRLVLIMLRQ